MTDEADISELQHAIENLYGGTGTYVQSVPVNETFGGKPVWKGAVHVFGLVDNPQATRAYAWSFERENGQRRIATVLHTDKINSPVAAVRAAIVAEHRGGQNDI